MFTCTNLPTALHIPYNNMRSQPTPLNLSRNLICKLDRRHHLLQVRKTISTIQISLASIDSRSTGHLYQLPTTPAATSITARARASSTVSELDCVSGQRCIPSMHAVNCWRDSTLASTISLCLGAEPVCQPRPADDDDAYISTRSRSHQKASAECTSLYQLPMKKKFAYRSASEGREACTRALNCVRQSPRVGPRWSGREPAHDEGNGSKPISRALTGARVCRTRGYLAIRPLPSTKDACTTFSLYAVGNPPGSRPLEVATPVVPPSSLGFSPALRLTVLSLLVPSWRSPGRSGLARVAASSSLFPVRPSALPAGRVAAKGRIDPSCR